MLFRKPMNNQLTMSVAIYRTRNWRHQRKAEELFKDYGLVVVMRHVYAGRITNKEKLGLKTKLKAVFTGKREGFYFFTLCQSCFAISDLRGYKGDGVFEPDYQGFEIVDNRWD